MAMITDVEYVLQAIRLSALRGADDPLTPRIISLDPSFALNPYINASGLSDIDRWPEIKRALDSPPPEPDAADEQLRDRDARRGGSGGGLQYTQTIVGAGRTGGMGMRVTGRTAAPGEGGRRRIGYTRANSSSAREPPSPITQKMRITEPTPGDDGLFSPPKRPRADSAPAPALLGVPAPAPPGVSVATGTSMITSGRGLGGGTILSGGLLEQALSISETSGDLEDAGMDNPQYSTLGVEAESSTGIGESARPSDLGLTAGDAAGALGEAMVDEGSDVEEEDIEDEGIRPMEQQQALDRRKLLPHLHERRVSAPEIHEKLVFAPIALAPPVPRGQGRGQLSALTAALNKHIPHLVSTSAEAEGDRNVNTTLSNPFASLYTSVAAPPSPISGKVRKDATVEEVTGFGLWKYWEEGREPLLSAEESDVRWSTIGWGLRMVEEDGEVDEDFPPLDRESQVHKFSYGQFAIVEATDSQIRQNAAKAPNIVRRPSRIIANVANTAPAQGAAATARPKIAQNPSASVSVSSFSSFEQPSINIADTTMKGSVGLSSALSKPVLLRVRVTASADVHFTTTISVPSDMYIADLTEILCKKKRLPLPATDWVLCLADLTLALPLDRTVSSLEGKNDLALVRTQWAVEHGLRIGDRRGGDPSASIFKRQSEPVPAQRFGPGLADFAQTYKKYTVQRKIAIGRHERVLAIDGDYIHIMPSESRAFFDSMKTTSFHITLVASCKLSGRAGGFKINVWRETGQKRYEFEAENGKQAAEIVSTIRQLMKSYQAERTSMLPPSKAAPRR
ncbi:hypothetical protein EHS25_008676 [Saitozyma podzolica]|uniref:Stress-activated map kinase-interacting protein 1 n=1 Tax=Saitozyma podzolica TaxID=1890683 RepID=A0A427YMI7_9TREE|nr:hypothetical protein EHS25_008676 [Saitozyma podzolica]